MVRFLSWVEHTAIVASQFADTVLSYTGARLSLMVHLRHKSYIQNT